IGRFYHHKDVKNPSYKLFRKAAFLEIGNLSAAFQRMTQEPKSKQKNLAKIHELVVLNHTFLSLAASLGTYIRHHKTTAATPHFDNYLASINGNMEHTLNIILQKEFSGEISTARIHEAQSYLDHKYRQLSSQLPLENSQDKTADYSVNPELQEVKLIADQLKWLLTIS